MEWNPSHSDSCDKSLRFYRRGVFVVQDRWDCVKIIEDCLGIVSECTAAVPAPACAATLVTRDVLEKAGDGIIAYAGGGTDVETAPAGLTAELAPVVPLALQNGIRL